MREKISVNFNINKLIYKQNFISKFYFFKLN
jgi:hypothetical protein